MKYIRKISDFAVVGGLSTLVLVSMSGCSNEEQKPQAQAPTNALESAAKKEGAFVVIQEIAPKEYKIIDEYPSSETRVILKDMNGSEKILSQNEIDQMLKDAEKKIDDNVSALTNPNAGGLSLGETILASAAGGLLGAWIGSKLFNNNSYDTQRRTTYSNPSTYERSKSSFSNYGGSSAFKDITNNTKSSTFNQTSTQSQTKSGFMSPNSASQTTTNSLSKPASNSQSTNSGFVKSGNSGSSFGSGSSSNSFGG